MNWSWNIYLIGGVNMRNGKFKIGKYNIEPTTSVDTFPSGEYNVVNTKNGVVYISKKPLELCGSDFWVTIYFEKMNIKIGINLSSFPFSFLTNT